MDMRGHAMTFPGESPVKHVHRNKRKHLPALNAEQRAALRHLYFVKKWKQVTLAIHYRIAQSTVAKYIASAS
jgi:DNA-binding transcriptional regulator LsrR (DeoR family)